MMENFIDNAFSNDSAIKRLMKCRQEQNIDRATLAVTIGLTEEEYASYELGLEEMPASVLFLASTFLTGNPLEFFHADDADADEEISKFMMH